jgi:hypothetical protein
MARPVHYGAESVARRSVGWRTCGPCMFGGRISGAINSVAVWSPVGGFRVARTVDLGDHHVLHCQLGSKSAR